MFKSISRTFNLAVARYCAFFFNRPIIGSVLILAVFVLSVSQARNIVSDGSIEGFFHSDAPEVADYNAFRRQFGQDGQIVIGVSSDNLFSAHILRKLAEFHKALAVGVPYIEDITSLYNIRSVVGGGKVFVVNDLLAHFLREGDTSPDALIALREAVLAHPIYRDLVISPDGEMTLITLRPDRFQPRSSEALNAGTLDLFAQFENAGDRASKAAFLSQREIGEMAQAAVKVAARFEDADFRIALSGTPMASSEIVRIISTDMPMFTRICLIVILIAVFLMTRRLSAVVTLVLVIAVSAAATIGLMAATGSAIKPPTQILPSIIIVVSACAVLHLILALVQARRETDGPSERAIKAQALQTAITRTAMPIVFTSLTTAAGLLAFSGSLLAPISDLGLFGAAAVMISLLVTLSLAPIAFRLFRFAPAGVVSGDGWGLRQAKAVSARAARHWSATLQITSIITLLAALGLFGLRFHHNSLEWLPADNPVRMDTETIDAKMHGSINLETVVRTNRAYGMQSEELLRELDALSSDIPAMARAQGFEVGKVFGVTDLLKEINHALLPGTPDSYRLPQGEMIAREFLLFENSASNDLPDFVDSRYTKTRMTIRVPWIEAGIYSGFINQVRDTMESRLSPLGMNSLAITGNMALLAQTSVNVIHSMAVSYGLSVLLIGALMLIAIGRLRLGLVSMLPNVLPIVITLGIMGYLGVPLDSFTILIGCIGLGLLVDDTIHFFHHIRIAEAEGLGPVHSVERAMHYCFLPILSTSVAVTLGFSAYAYSTMSNIVAFGLLTALVALLGLLAELVLSPALVGALHAHDKQRAAVRATAAAAVAGAIAPAEYSNPQFQ